MVGELVKATTNAAPLEFFKGWDAVKVPPRPATANISDNMLLLSGGFGNKGDVLARHVQCENVSNNWFGKGAVRHLFALRHLPSVSSFVIGWRLGVSAFCDHVMNIVFRRPNKKMFRIDAFRIVTPMKDKKTFGNRPISRLVCHAMNKALLSVVVNGSVSFVVEGFRPLKAAFFANRGAGKDFMKFHGLAPLQNSINKNAPDAIEAGV
jgi:hypothetical protein